MGTIFKAWTYIDSSMDLYFINAGNTNCQFIADTKFEMILLKI